MITQTSEDRPQSSEDTKKKACLVSTPHSSLLTPHLLKGKPIADQNKQYCIDLVAEMVATRTPKTEPQKSTPENLPHLVVILIGNDPASEYYVQSIQKQSLKYGVKVTLSHHQDISQDALITEIQALNTDPTVHGIMIQKPLPKHIDPNIIELTIDPDKDIDGFHPLNAGLMLQEKDCFLPCTAQAILEIMDFYQISPEGKHTVVVGRSNVVGKPIANLLLYKAKNRNATVTICHSRTTDLKKYTLQADILITAVGVPHLIKADMIKDGVVIIDAGINEVLSDERGVLSDINSSFKTPNSTQPSTFNPPHSKIVGDTDFDNCLHKTSAITPVPGGVGSVTTSILFKHLCLSAKKILEK